MIMIMIVKINSNDINMNATIITNNDNVSNSCFGGNNNSDDNNDSCYNFNIAY